MFLVPNVGYKYPTYGLKAQKQPETLNTIIATQAGVLSGARHTAQKRHKRSQ